MRKYIKKLQNKSEMARKRILIGVLSISMILISVIWVYNIGNRFNNPEIKSQTREDVKPFKLFANSLSDTYKNIRASVGNIPNIKKENKNQVKKEKQIELILVKNTDSQ